MPGGPPAKGFLDATLDEWRKAVNQNFLSTVYFAPEVIPHMQRKQVGTDYHHHLHYYKAASRDLVLSNAVRATVVGLVRVFPTNLARMEF